MNNLKVSVIIPAYNEEDRIGSTINTLGQIESVSQIIVIDDGSVDDTAGSAKNAGAEVIKLTNNQGKGTALNTGAQYIKENFVALVDADLGETVREIEKLFTPIFSGYADMSIAVFPPSSKKGGVGLVKKTATWGLKVLTNNNFTAPLSGQRVMTKQLLKDLLPFASGFGVEVGMTVDAIVKGYKIVEVQTAMGHKETGRDLRGFIHRGVQFKDVCFTLTMKGWRKWSYS